MLYHVRDLVLQMTSAKASIHAPEQREAAAASTRDYMFLLKLTSVTIVATLGLIALGGAVRATGSGLACPDWPLCDGQALPLAERGTTIEFAHRMTATAVGSLALGIALYSTRVRRESPGIFYVAVLAGVLVVLQILLGAAVVFAKLPAELVTAHLGLATAFAAALAVIASQAFISTQIGASSDISSKTLAATLLACVLTYGMLLLGAYVGSSGSSLACASWPLCNDTLIPSGDWRPWIGFAHRLLAIAMTASVAWAAWTAFAGNTPRLVRNLLFGAFALTVVEIFVGALNPILRVPAAVAVTHLTVATIIWLLLSGAATICLSTQRREIPAQA